MSKAFYDWVTQASDTKGGHLRKSGAVLMCNSDGKVHSRLEWGHGLITAISFPALDGSAKTQGALTLKITPEYTTHVPGNGGQAPAQFSQQKLWLVSNFRLKIDGLEDACSRVSRVGPITISYDVRSVPVGDVRDPASEIGRRRLSDLIITLPESRAAKLYDWFEDFVVKGNNSADKEKAGTLELLAPSLSSTLFVVHFGHLGVYQITQATGGPAASIHNITAKMYCESIHFEAKGAAS
jgi:hypothetical protein